MKIKRFRIHINTIENPRHQTQLPKRLKSLLKEHYIPIFFFVILNLRVLTWFRRGHVLFSGDFRPFLSCLAFNQNTQGFLTLIDFGSISFYFTRKLSFFDVLSLMLYKIIKNITISQMIATYTLYLVYSIIVYTLFITLTENKIVAPIATFYMITNPLLLNDREVTALGFVNYYYLPVMIPVTLTSIAIKKKSHIMAIISGLTTILSIVTFPNYRNIIYIIFFMFIIVISFVIKKTEIEVKSSHEELMIKVSIPRIRKIYKLIFTFALSAIIINLPLSFAVFKIYRPLYSVLKESTQKVVTTDVTNIYPLDTLRFIGRWGFYSGALGRLYVPYSIYYLENNLFKIITYTHIFIMLLTLYLVIKYKEHRKLYFYYGLISLIGFIFSIFIIEFESFKLFVQHNIIFRLFLEPIHVLFYSTFGISIIIGIFIDLILKNVKGINKGLALTIFVLSLLSISSYPLFTGDVTTNWLEPSTKGYQIPIDFYGKLDKMMLSNYWVLLVPSRYTYITYKEPDGLWGSGNPYPKLLGVPFISGLGTEYVPSPVKEYVNWIYDLFSDDNVSSSDIIKVLSLSGVKYVLIEKNLIYGYKSYYSIYESKLLKSDLVSSKYSDTSRTLVEISNANQLVYVASRWSFYRPDNPNNILSAIRNYSLGDIKGLVLINENNSLVRSKLSRARVSSSKLISVKIISPGHIKVRALSDGYFLLILETSYDPNWKVYVNGIMLNEDLHFKANGFGNGWLIPTKGELIIDVRYDLNTYLNIYNYYILVFVLYTSYKIIVLITSRLSKYL